MRDIDIQELSLDKKKHIEATVESEEMLFSNDLDDRGYILDTEDGKRKWSLKGDEVEGDDFGKGDYIEIFLKERRKMKPWVGSRLSLSDGEPERRFVVEKMSSDKKE